MSVFVDASRLGLLVAMTGTVAISAVVLIRSVQEEDAGSVWVWAGVFAMSSLLAALSFWRLA